MGFVTKLIVFLVVCGVLLLVILLPLSLQRLGINELGIRYDKVTRDVGTKALREGLHDVGPSGTLLKFETSQRDASFTNFRALSSDGLAISLTVIITYSINPARVLDILNDFGAQTQHDQYIADVCSNAIYDTASLTSGNDFYTKRQKFQLDLENRTKTSFVDFNVHAFFAFAQVININLPSGIVNALTQTTIAQQDISNAASERGAATQQAQINLDLATSQANITILAAELRSAIIAQEAVQSVLSTRTRFERRTASFSDIVTSMGSGGDFFVTAYLKPLVLAKGGSRTVINV